LLAFGRSNPLKWVPQAQGAWKQEIGLARSGSCLCLRLGSGAFQPKQQAAAAPVLVSVRVHPSSPDYGLFLCSHLLTDEEQLRLAQQQVADLERSLIFLEKKSSNGDGVLEQDLRALGSSQII